MKIMKIFLTCIKTVFFTDKIVPLYKLADLTEDKDGDIIATIQVINSSTIFRSRPVEILENDNYVKSMNPIDVRTLTILGYEHKNRPQYQILAKRLAEKENYIVLKKYGSQESLFVTAEEIDGEMLVQMSSSDAHDVGYMLASGQIKKELQQIRNEN
jgi:hypothetical protein